MRFYVEPSPKGAWYVRLAGHDAPISRHDSEEEAIERRDAYARGAARDEGGSSELRDGDRVRIRPIRSDDKPRLVEAFDGLGDTSRYRRFLGYKKELSVAELVSLTEVDHHEHEALGALDPETGEGVGVAPLVREPGPPRGRRGGGHRRRRLAGPRPRPRAPRAGSPAAPARRACASSRRPCSPTTGRC